MNDWKKIIDEKVSRGHRQKVLSEAAELLRDYKSPRRAWMRGALVASFGSAVAVVLALRSKHSVEESQPARDEVEVAVMDPELLEDSDLLMDLELLEDLDELEQWEEG